MGLGAPKKPESEIGLPPELQQFLLILMMIFMLAGGLKDSPKSPEGNKILAVAVGLLDEINKVLDEQDNLQSEHSFGHTQLSAEEAAAVDDLVEYGIISGEAISPPPIILDNDAASGCFNLPEENDMRFKVLADLDDADSASGSDTLLLDLDTRVYPDPRDSDSLLSMHPLPKFPLTVPPDLEPKLSQEENDRSIRASLDIIRRSLGLPKPDDGRYEKWEGESWFDVYERMEADAAERRWMLSRKAEILRVFGALKVLEGKVEMRQDPPDFSEAQEAFRKGFQLSLFTTDSLLFASSLAHYADTYYEEARALIAQGDLTEALRALIEAQNIMNDCLISDVDFLLTLPPQVRDELLRGQTNVLLLINEVGRRLEKYSGQREF